MTYSESLRDPRWQRKRLEILKRDNWTCQDCHRRDLELQIHHCYYLIGMKPWEQPSELMMTLCFQCHPKRQKLEQACHVQLAWQLSQTDPERLDSMTWEFLRILFKTNTDYELRELNGL